MIFQEDPGWLHAPTNVVPNPDICQMYQIPELIKGLIMFNGVNKIDNRKLIDELTIGR